MQTFVRYLRKMRRVLQKEGYSRDDIDDLTQDAFVRLLEYCKSGREVREPEALLVTTVRRLALNQIRDRSRDRLDDSPIEKLLIIDPAPPPEMVFEATQRLRNIRSTLKPLGPQTWQVFFLQRLYGYNYEQISEVTRMPISTIEKHIGRAMTALIKERRRAAQLR